MNMKKLFLLNLPYLLFVYVGVVCKGHQQESENGH